MLAHNPHLLIFFSKVIFNCVYCFVILLFFFCRSCFGILHSAHCYFWPLHRHIVHGYYGQSILWSIAISTEIQYFVPLKEKIIRKIQLYDLFVKFLSTRLIMLQLIYRNCFTSSHIICMNLPKKKNLNWSRLSQYFLQINSRLILSQGSDFHRANFKPVSRFYWCIIILISVIW